MELELITRCKAAIAAAGSHVPQNIGICYVPGNDQIILTGTARSFYIKQQIQEAMRALVNEYGLSIVNEVQVPLPGR